MVLMVMLYTLRLLILANLVGIATIATICLCGKLSLQIWMCAKVLYSNTYFCVPLSNSPSNVYLQVFSIRVVCALFVCESSVPTLWPHLNIPGLFCCMLHFFFLGVIPCQHQAQKQPCVNHCAVTPSHFPSTGS